MPPPGQLRPVADPDILERGGDNASGSSYFIANVHNELYAF